jgi:hypothetical protein
LGVVDDVAQGVPVVWVAGARTGHRGPCIGGDDWRETLTPNS